MNYRDQIASALAEGFRFAGLYAAAGGVVHVALIAPSGALLRESVVAQDGRVPTIVDLTAAAGWDEREAADLYGIYLRRPRTATTARRARSRARELDGRRSRR